jgi:hypothetical protein
MITLPYRFMLTGIVLALVGMCIGIWMGTNGPSTFNYAAVHAHINLAGWATFMLFGLWYRGAPQAASTTVASVHYWVALVGVVCLVLGIVGAVAPNPSLDLLVIPGSLLTLLSMLMFLWVVWSESRKGV